MNCFHIKNDYEVCPYCGYVEGEGAKESFQLSPGATLQGRYIIGEALGYGGFGIIYKAFDTTLGVVVAVKEFYPSGLVKRAAGEIDVGLFAHQNVNDYQKQKNRFMEEARNMALFSKEKDIVNVLNYFEENMTAYIIMEYVRYPVLKDYLKEHQKMDESKALECTCALLTALQKIHNQGIIHRDISPDNLFYLDTGGVKVFDFGAARLQNDVDIQNPVVKSGYAPPEQYLSRGHQDHRMDIYAAGAVLYHLLTGEKPVESLERMDNDCLKLPGKMGIRLKRPTEQALLKALSLKAEDRFNSAQEFKDALTAADASRRRWGRWV